MAIPRFINRTEENHPEGSMNWMIDDLKKNNGEIIFAKDFRTIEASTFSIFNIGHVLESFGTRSSYNYDLDESNKTEIECNLLFFGEPFGNFNAEIDGVGVMSSLVYVDPKTSILEGEHCGYKISNYSMKSINISRKEEIHPTHFRGGW